MKELASMARRTPIEPEGELIQVVVQLLIGHAAVEGSKDPALEQGRDSMHPGQHANRSLFRLPIEDRPSMVEALSQSVVAPGPVSDDDAAFGNVFADEPLQALSRGISNPLEPYPPHPFVAGFDCDDDDVSADVTSPLRPMTSYQRFVHLYRPRQPLAAEPDHGSAKFMEHRPCGLVASKPKGTLEAQCTDAALLVHDTPHRTEPDTQRQFAVLENRAGEERDVPAAISTPPKPSAHRPSLPAPTATTLESVGPPQLKEILAAGFFGAKPVFEIEDGSWKLSLHKRIL